MTFVKKYFPYLCSLLAAIYAVLFKPASTPDFVRLLNGISVFVSIGLLLLIAVFFYVFNGKQDSEALRHEQDIRNFKAAMAFGVFGITLSLLLRMQSYSLAPMMQNVCFFFLLFVSAMFIFKAAKVVF